MYEHDIVVVQIALAMQLNIGRRPTTQVKVASITPVGFVIDAYAFKKEAPTYRHAVTIGRYGVSPQGD